MEKNYKNYLAVEIENYVDANGQTYELAVALIRQTTDAKNRTLVIEAEVWGSPELFNTGANSLLQDGRQPNSTFVLRGTDFDNFVATHFDLLHQNAVAAWALLKGQKTSLNPKGEFISPFEGASDVIVPPSVLEAMTMATAQATPATETEAAPDSTNEMSEPTPETTETTESRNTTETVQPPLESIKSKRGVTNG